MSTSADELCEEVRRRYAESARGVEGLGRCGCGSGSCSADAESDTATFGQALYDAEQHGELPAAATLASLGCGNPTAVADLHEGETVLDLGSGGGIDVRRCDRRVGATGVEYGVDMTDEIARTRAAKQTRSRSPERPLPEGHDGSGAASRRVGRCRYLELR